VTGGPGAAAVGRGAGDPDARNRRTALWLLGWIAFLAAMAVLVAWTRN
jgi:hypothetical protein